MQKHETLRGKFNTGFQVALRYLPKPVEQKHIFAVGFYTGQLEKLIAGACNFCMFRPDERDRGVLQPILHILADEFGLYLYEFTYYDPWLDDNLHEIWIYSHVGDVECVEALAKMQVNSAIWHRSRAELCGISPMFVDSQYHKRAGHAQTKHIAGQC